MSTMRRFLGVTLFVSLSALSVAAVGAAPNAAPASTSTAKTARPAKALELKAFFGEWQGTAKAMSETDEDFSSTNRDVAVSIKANELGGFVLSWSTLQRQKGDPKAPLEVLKSTTVDFIPTADANRWQAKQSANVYAGGILYWARLETDTLVVTTFTIGRDGAPEMQTYRRKLSGGRMKLNFSNIKDGDVQRTVSGDLARVR